MNSDGLQLEAICTYYLPLVVYRLKSLYTFCLNTLLLPYLLVLMVFFPNKILNYLKKNFTFRTPSISPEYRMAFLVFSRALVLGWGCSVNGLI